MELTYRIVGEARMQQVRDLWDYCFEKKDEPFFKYYFDEYCGRDNTVIGGFEKIDDWEHLRTMLHVNPYMLRLRGQELLTPYLVGIATAPEARGRRLLRPLLCTAFEVMRSQQFAFTFLMPIYAGIYLPYEFAYCYYRRRYELPLGELEAALPTAADDIVLERLPLAASPDALAAVQQLTAPLYAGFTASVNGAPLRTPFQWRKLLSVHALEGVQCVAARQKNEPVGYMFYKIEGGVFKIIELVSTELRARQQLLRYAAGHHSEARSLYWLAEPWDSTYLGMGNQTYSGALAPFMMARCLDARLALARLAAPQDLPEGNVTLLLTDKLLERNNHLLKLKTAPGSLEAVSTLDEEELTLDMGAFSQLYFGTFSVYELAEAGRIRVNKPEKLGLVDALLPKRRTWINEYF